MYIKITGSCRWCIGAGVLVHAAVSAPPTGRGGAGPEVRPVALVVVHGAAGGVGQARRPRLGLGGEARDPVAVWAVSARDLHPRT